MRYSTLTELVTRWEGACVLVVGDVMLDRYTQLAPGGRCPEADAPILHPTASFSFAGGAANAAANVRRLGARPVLIGAVGADPAAAELRDLLDRADVDSRLVVSPGQPTTTKHRLVNPSGRMIARIDENQRGLTPSEERVLAAEIRSAYYLMRPDAILLSDYSKGVLTPRSEVCAVLRELNPLVDVVVLDPRRSLLGGEIAVDAVTPNQHEAAALGGAQRSRFFDELPGLQVIAETRGAKGALIRRKTGAVVMIPTVPATDPHVCGAGDTFAAALTLARVAGAGWEDAARIANAAAGIAVRHVSTYAPSADALRDVLMKVAP